MDHWTEPEYSGCYPEILEIQLDHIGKRFTRAWIFRDISLKLKTGEHLAILGANGSGKSTLLQIISGYLTPSEGTMEWKRNKESMTPDTLYRRISVCAPYSSLFEDFTLRENLQFHSKFKSFKGNDRDESLAEKMLLAEHLDKPLRFFSSGMKQRVKIALALLSETDLVLLDEPCTHLDAAGIQWYNSLLGEYEKGRTIVIASNNKQVETALCQRTVSPEEFRKPDVQAAADR